MSASSSSLTPRSATALILTPSPAASAAARPSRTCSSRPQRVISVNLSLSSVSIETLIRRTPAAYRSSANRASWLPLVVSVSSSSAPSPRCRPRRSISQRMLRRTRGSPPVRRSLRTPRSTKALHKPVELFEGQHLRLRQERHRFRHAVDAAEVATVGDRNPEIGDPAVERVDQNRQGRSRTVPVRTRRSVPGTPIVHFPRAALLNVRHGN